MVPEHDNLPLVSIIIPTYNSSESVLETLESAFEQTYNKVELIVTDDCSKDDTVEIVKNWIKEHAERFIRSEIITSEINTGIPGNSNRALKIARGEWIKFIAGDDILLPQCVSDNVDHVLRNPEVKLLFSGPIIFFKDESLKLENIDNYFEQSKIYYNRSSEEQYNVLLDKNFLFAPSAFILRDVFITLDGYDESIRGMEDYPFWLKASKYGYSFHYLDKKTIRYRISASSQTGSKRFHKAMKETFFKYRFIPYLKKKPLKAIEQWFYYSFMPLSLKIKSLKSTHH